MKEEKNVDLQPDHLENELIKLVPLKSADFERLFAVASDPLIWEQHPARDRYQREIFQTFFDEGIKSEGAFMILDAKTNEPIGSSRFYEYDDEKKIIAVGYTFLARNYWGGEYNKALKQLMLDYAFTFAETVIFHIGKENIRSQKATEKFGAKMNEPLTLAENDEKTLVFSLNKKDWLNRNIS